MESNPNAQRQRLAETTSQLHGCKRIACSGTATTNLLTLNGSMPHPESGPPQTAERINILQMLIMTDIFGCSVTVNEGVGMELITITEIVNTGLSFVIPVLAGVVPVVGAIFGAKSGAGRSLVAHVSAAYWVRSLRRTGSSDEEIKSLLEEAARRDLTR